MLARKWRPQIFSDVVGQEHVLTALANGLSLGRIHHAYLLSGTRGVGKTTIARLLAKGLNCEIGITANPCGQCNNCHAIEQGCFVDLIEIDAASRTKVEDTRELLDNVQYAPARGRFKVYLIDEVHMLSRHSFNALLKIMEEPPAHVKFLLATTDPKKLPVTTLSRCLQFHLKALNVEQIRGQLSTVLQQEHIATTPRALQLLAHAADGSMRDALSLADQAIAMGQGEVTDKAVSMMLDTLNTKQSLALIEELANANSRAVMAQLEQCATRGVDWENLLLEILSLLHRLAMGQLLPDQLNDEEDPKIITRLQKLSRRLPPTDLQLYYQILLIGRKELPFAPNPRIGVEMTLLRALAFHPTTVKTSVSPASAEKKIAVISGRNRYGNLSRGALIASDSGVSVDYQAAHTAVNFPHITKEQTETSLGGESTITARIAPANKDLIQVYTASGFDDNEKQRDWLPDRLMLENTETPTPHPASNSPLLLDTTAQILQARTTLMRRQESKKTKKDELAPTCQKVAGNALKQMTNMNKRVQQHQFTDGQKNPVKTPRLEAYHWRASQQPEAEPQPPTTSKALHMALEHKKKVRTSVLSNERIDGA